MSREDFSPHQQKIIKRYYNNQDGIQRQRLAELVSELYLSEGKKREGVWKRVISALQKLDSRADSLSQFTTYFDDPEGVAREAERYLEITPGDLMDFVAGCCTASQRVVVSVVPRDAG